MVHVEARFGHTANSRYSRLFAVKDPICKPSAETACFIGGANSAAPLVHFAAFAAYGLSP